MSSIITYAAAFILWGVLIGGIYAIFGRMLVNLLRAYLLTEPPDEEEKNEK